MRRIKFQTQKVNLGRVDVLKVSAQSEGQAEKESEYDEGEKFVAVKKDHWAVVVNPLLPLGDGLGMSAYSAFITSVSGRSSFSRSGNDERPGFGIGVSRYALTSQREREKQSRFKVSLPTPRCR